MSISVSVDYTPLFQKMKEKSLSSYRLSKDFGIPEKTFYNLRQNRFVTVETLAKLAYILDTDIDGLVTVSCEEYKDV